MFSLKSSVKYYFWIFICILLTISSSSLIADDGEAIYKKSCFACHDSGVSGAPIPGDKDAWAARIKQGPEILNQHAIEGYTGATGIMPAKGGFSNLSDAEVIAAVEYMVELSK